MTQEGARFPDLEFEEDRIVRNLGFKQISFEDSLKDGTFDTMSMLFSDKDMLLTLITLSNFSLAPFEIRRRLAGLAQTTGDISTEDYLRVESGHKLLGEVTRISDALGFTRSLPGIATFYNGKRFTKRRVSFLSNERAFTLALITADLLTKYGSVFDFPKRTEGHVVGNNFLLQISALKILSDDALGIVSIDDIYRVSRQVRNKEQSAMKQLVMAPLISAGFIEIEGELAIINSEDVVVDQPQSPLRDLLLKIIAQTGQDQKVLMIPYQQLSRMLVEAWSQTHEENISVKEIHQKVASFLLYLKQRGNLKIDSIWQNDLSVQIGNSSRSDRYRITDEGRAFLQYIMDILEAPDLLLGPASLYHCFKDSQLLEFSQLSNEYKTLLLYLLPRVFA